MVNCRIYRIRNLSPRDLPEALNDYEEEHEEGGLELRKAVTKQEMKNDMSGWFDFQWDTVGQSHFHGEEITYGRTHYCTVWFGFESSEGHFYVFTKSGDHTGARYEVSDMLFDDDNDMRRLPMTSDHLTEIIRVDSDWDSLMWWHNVTDDCDGALKGNLQSGLRDRFDRDGDPYFDKFDSKHLGKSVSISIRKSSVTSSVGEENLVQYIKDIILPIVEA